MMKLCVVLLVLVASCAAIQITDPNFSFLSQNVNTKFVIRRDANRAANQGIDVTAVISGAGAPTVPEGELLSVSGGSVVVKAGEGASTGTTNSPNNNSGANSLRKSSPFLLSALVCIFGLIVGPRHRYLGIGAIALALIGGCIAQLQFNADWTVEVTATIPSTLSLQSLSITISRGSLVVEEGADLSVSSSVNVDLCDGGSNFVNIDTSSFSLSGKASFCATKKLVVNNVVLAQGASINAVSNEDSAFVFVKSQSAFSGAFEVLSSKGFAVATPCEDKFMSTELTGHQKGSCSIAAASSTTISGYFDAVLEASDDSSRLLKVAKRWSDAQTWGGQIPGNGTNVVIASDQVIMIDTTTASIGTMEIRGTLIADPEKNFSITASRILVYGTLRVGSVHSPYAHKGYFTLTGAKNNYTSRAPLGGFSNDATSRVLFGYPGSNIQMHGAGPRNTYTRLNAHAANNSVLLTVDSTAGWKVGDWIAISPTTFPSTSSTDYRQIVAINPAINQVTINQGLSYPRWGRLQYMTDQGVSLQPGVFNTMRAHPNVPSILDERAVIVHLTRNIVIQSINDSDWLSGHGAHFMWMGQTTQVQINGIEVHRAGQAGALGRYAIHSHMQSYSMAGTSSISDLTNGDYVGDATKVFVRNCAVHNSVNRAYVIHGTCGARYENNVAFNILGHAYFFEDGSEVRNHFIGNVALHIKAPPTNLRLLRHDENAAGVWFTNGDNHFRNNIVGDSRDGFGIWNAMAERPYPTFADIVAPSSVTFTPMYNDGGYAGVLFQYQARRENWTLTYKNATHWGIVGTKSGVQPDVKAGEVYFNGIARLQISAGSPGDRVTYRVDGYAGGCFGQSKYVELFPRLHPIVDYTNNTAFSCRAAGFITDNYPVDEYGNTGSNGFVTTNDSKALTQQYNDPRQIPTHFDGHHMWMNSGGGYTNRVHTPLYTAWLGADNLGVDISGQTMSGQLVNSLFIGHSLNDLEPGLKRQARHAFASYHFAFNFVNISLFNYPPVPTVGEKTSYGYILDMNGVMQSWDLYLSSVEMGAIGSSNWKKFNCATFERSPPPNFEMWYPNSTGGPFVRNRFWTFSGALYDYGGVFSDYPRTFLTFDHPFYTLGLKDNRPAVPGSKTIITSHKFYGFHQGSNDLGDAAYHPVTFVRVDNNYNDIPGTNWTIEDGTTSSFLPNMRHASVMEGGRYRVFNHINLTPNRLVYDFTIFNGMCGVEGITDIKTCNSSVIVGIPWSRNVPAFIDVQWDNWFISYTQVSSLQQLSTTPNGYFQETSRDIFWYHHHHAGRTMPGLMVRPRA